MNRSLTLLDEIKAVLLPPRGGGQSWLGDLSPSNSWRGGTRSDVAYPSLAATKLTSGSLSLAVVWERRVWNAPGIPKMMLGASSTRRSQTPSRGENR